MPPSPERWTFDLETAITNWRSFAARARSIEPDDLDELEIHVRDMVDALVAAGDTPEEAFRKALVDIGDLASLERWYDRVSAEKRRRRGLPAEIRSGLALASSYLLAARRNLMRHRTITLLNVGGLAIGLAAVTLIGAFIVQSLSYDREYPNAVRNVRVIWDGPEGQWMSGTPHSLPDLIEKSFTGAEAVTVVGGFRYLEVPISVGNDHFLVDGIIHTDEDFFSVFSVNVVSRTRLRPLTEKGGMALTESTARRLFGDGDPLGRVVRLNSSTDYTVEAIVEDPPTATHLPFNVLVRSRPTTPVTDWRYDARAYVRLKPRVDPASLTSFLKEEVPKASDREFWAEREFRTEYVRDIHLRSSAVDQYATVGDIRYLWIFGAIGAVIALLAVINYTNLSTAQALRRSREVGIRKVVGATRSQLRSQYVGESVLLTLISVPAAAVLVRYALPRFEQVTGEALPADLLADPILLAAVGGTIILIALTAGWYPALLLSRLRPNTVLSGRGSIGSDTRLLKQVLVGFQVAVSFAMIASTLVVSRQMTFVREVDLGFDQEHVVTVNTPGWSYDQVEAFRQRLAGNPAVVSSAAGIPPGINWRSSSGREPIGPDDEEVPLSLVHVGPGFFETMGIELDEGREFRMEDLSKDPPPVVISRSWKQIMYPGEPVLGRDSEIGMGWSGGEIVGVSEDIYNESLLDDTYAVAFIMNPQELVRMRIMVARLAEGRTREGLDALEAAWKEIEPDRVFTFQFLDDQIQRQYATETRLAEAFDLFAGVSIFVALLGLFGLATLTAQQRVREIGIRKVLGATVPGILALLLKDFLRLVAIGGFVTIPPVVIFGNRWLDNFSRHVEIGPGLFIAAGALVLTLVVLAVGAQSLRAALANPAESIRQD